MLRSWRAAYRKRSSNALTEVFAIETNDQHKLADSKAFLLLCDSLQPGDSKYGITLLLCNCKGFSCREMRALARMISWFQVWKLILFSVQAGRDLSAMTSMKSIGRTG